MTRSVREVRATTPASRAKLATQLARTHRARVFTMAPEDLAAPPHERLRAALALLDAAEVAGAVVLLAAADHLAAGRAGEVALAERLHAFPGAVVLATDGLDEHSPLRALVEARGDA